MSLSRRMLLLAPAALAPLLPLSAARGCAAPAAPMPPPR
jgi:hypothetical protein